MNTTGGINAHNSDNSCILDRRSFLLTPVVAIAAACLPAKVLAQNVSNTEQIQELLDSGLDNPENMRVLRQLIKSELASSYRANPQAGFPTYDVSRIDSDAVYFGNVKGNISSQIRFLPESKTHYDNRIQGKIDIYNLEPILSQVGGRIRELEQSGNIAFIMKDQNGVDIFVYYEAGVLKYVLPTTTGDASTPDNMIVRGSYHRAKGIDYTDRQLANYYNLNGTRLRGAMPYSRRLSTIDSNNSIHYEGINTHIGNVAPGQSSHGCARQSALGAALLYHTMKRDTIVYYRPNIFLEEEI